MQNDIEPYDNWFWVEASGPIEHYFKKHNGNPIPNYLVYKFLRKPKKDIVELNVDGVHYKRFLNTSDYEPTEKMIFGFKNQASMDLVMDKIDNYGQFKIDVNDTLHDLFEDEPYATDDKKSLTAASVFIQELDEKYEGGFNEMLPSWKKALDQALDYLQKMLPYVLSNSNVFSKNKTEQIKSAIRHGNNLLKYMPLLQLHTFKLDA